MMASCHPSTGRIRPCRSRSARRTLTSSPRRSGARDLPFRFIGPDTLVVTGMAADDLGWLAAGAGVVVYAMVAGEPPPDR